MLSTKNHQLNDLADFQTPKELVDKLIKILLKIEIQPQAIVEPTCGKGEFILSSIKFFPSVKQIIGVEINQAHLKKLAQEIELLEPNLLVKTLQADFFTLNWNEILAQLPQPLLVIGNPPWITNSSLGLIASSNLPQKSNLQDLTGLEAVTGKSNFDISEWMLLEHFSWFKKRIGTIAVICKISVARKLLAHAWKHNYPLFSSRIYKIDSFKYFGVIVEAGFFVVEFNFKNFNKICLVYDNLNTEVVSHQLGYHNEIILNDLPTYSKLQHLHKIDKNYTWRSGIKHDCNKIMELTIGQDGYINGNGQIVRVEETYLYPLFKSSDIANNRTASCRKYLLVTQKHIGEDTSHIEKNAPQTWAYLQANIFAFAKRKSKIYRARPPFSIFGVGEYTFAPWKVAISGFYKKLFFTLVNTINGRPAVFDDTVYFLPCYSQEEANFLVEMLNSSIAKEFYNSMVFWGDKRPITVNLLKRLNLQALAKELGREEEYLAYVKLKPMFK